MNDLRPDMFDPEFLLEHIRRDTKFDADLLEKIISEWKRYKATGLEPEEIMVKDDILACSAIVLGTAVAHIRGLLAAEKDGRLWLSPFPLNDSAKLYAPRKNDVQEQTVQYITLLDGEPSVAVSFDCDYECAGCPHNAPYTNYEAGDGGCDGEGGFGVILISEIGKTVFLTRAEAEAEAALRGDKR